MGVAGGQRWGDGYIEMNLLLLPYSRPSFNMTVWYQNEKVLMNLLQIKLSIEAWTLHYLAKSLKE